jgi:hypothetical protein
MGNNNIKTSTNLEKNHVECSFCKDKVPYDTITRDDGWGELCMLCIAKMKCFQMI